MMLQRTSQDVTLINEYITETLSGYIRLLNSISPTLEREFNNKTSELPIELQDVSSANDEILAVYITTNNGEFYDYPDIDLPHEFDAQSRNWFIKAKENPGKVVITEPYIDPASKKAVVTISKELSNGKGVIGIDLSLNYLKEMILNLKVGKNGYPVLLDENQKIVVHPIIEFGESPSENLLSNVKFSSVPYIFSTQSTYYISLTNKLTGWTVIGLIDKTELTDNTVPIIFNTGIYIFIFLIIGGFVVYYIIRIITIPTNRLLIGIDQVKKGNLNVRVPITANDEFGKLSEAFNQMIYSFRNTMTKLKESQLAEMDSKRMAYTDELTGLPNRRNMIEKMRKLIVRTSEQNTNFSVLFIDLDGFKKVNDKHGHDIGDKLLIEVAIVLKECICQCGMAFRWAGDEFVLLLDNSKNNIVQEELIANIERKICEITNLDGCPIQISASIGVAQYPRDGMEFKPLLDHADHDMYTKKARRNH